MKTGKTLALLVLVSFLGASCAAVSPPIVEHEEELTSMAGTKPEEIREGMDWVRYWNEYFRLNNSFE
jgi:hypothetical protein